MSRLVLFGLCGVAIQVLFQWAFVLLGPATFNASWYAVAAPPLATLGKVLPALLAGFLAKRHGFLLGALVGGLGGLISAWPPGESGLLTPVAWFSLFSISPAVVGSAAGAAGQLVAAKLPSNKSFKPNPLRGSA